MRKVLPTRLRRTPALRRLITETKITMDEIVYPIFLVEGEGIKKEISSMKGQYHLSIDQLEKEVAIFKQKGIASLLLFGIPNEKDEKASSAYAADGIIQRAIRKIKEMDQDMLVITDICLCEYKSDGHCCIYNEKGLIERTKTLELLGKIAVSHAQAGADILAPSDMMDGRIAFMRQKLDEEGYEHLPIMSYSAKYASAFYGPFREAAHSAPQFGDRKMYQMDPANAKEALKEMELDVEEGADILMVKPAGPYLDILRSAKECFDLPLAAYQVSGEYAMLEGAIREGLLSKDAIYESLLGMKRAGANVLITYFAPYLQELLIERERRV
jgi:porphobilinogen synthase